MFSENKQQNAVRELIPCLHNGMHGIFPNLLVNETNSGFRFHMTV